MSTPQLSIVFPSYQRPEDVRTTVALLRQNVDVDYELFIVDNSPQPMQLQTLSHEHYIFMGTNAGTAARNVGIERAQAAYILMLDDDSHPLANRLAASIASLEAAPAEVAGLIATVTRLDGSYETSLLPTVLLGCGVLFRTHQLRQVAGGYPENFCFYGEEYWLTMALYRLGMRLQHSDLLRVQHRLTPTARSRDRVFYFLGRNNGIIWKTFAPPNVQAQVLADTFRRYELIAAKEGVSAAFGRGRQDELQLTAAPTPLSMPQFRAFALLDQFDRVCRQVNSKHLLLLGAGKFPGFWADTLQQQWGFEEVWLADLNPGLQGKRIGSRTVLSPEQAAHQLSLAPTALLCGHTARADARHWQQWGTTHASNGSQLYWVTDRG